VAKPKIQYTCQSCDATFNKWSGQCGDCKEWNTLEEGKIPPTKVANRFAGYAGLSNNPSVQNLTEVAGQDIARNSSGLGELDLALGGGLVAGSVILIGGDPGVGKSTLLLQAVAEIAKTRPCLYVSGEESAQQIKLRADRLNANSDGIRLLMDTSIERILAAVDAEKPSVLVIDSIQTMHTEALSSAPGAVAQVRESTALLVRFAKATNTTIFLIGHVTKDGSLAGPRILEHMVDTVLYFEGKTESRYRLLRAIKNRFGAVNELGVFAMQENGLIEVKNPSAIFLSRSLPEVSGSVVMVTKEASRPLLVEVQALVDQSQSDSPRRLALGIEPSRLAMLLAVLNRHAGFSTAGQDVFINLVGGVRVTETASDLAVLMAILSSIKNKPLDPQWVIFGEIGLAGEIRPVPNGQERLMEAQKHGFKKAIIPWANRPTKGSQLNELEVIPLQKISDALDLL